MDTYFLKSERLGFRTWTAEDFMLALRLWGDPKVTQFIDARVQLTNAQVKERLAQEISTCLNYGIQYWPVFVLDNDRFIGCCGLRPYKPEESILELGVHLCSDQWGKGYASEAARTVMNYAFNKLGVEALFAGHNPNNLVSMHLLNKLRFRYTHNEYYDPTGLMHPSYRINAEEFIH